MHRLALSAIFLASFAHAHGPAPTALELFLNSEGRVTLVHTNIGLASPKAEGGYRYLCPILWGEDDYFPVPIVDADGNFAVPVGDTLYRGNACDLSPQQLDGWTGQLGGQSGALLLERNESASRVWRVSSTPEVLWETSERTIDSVLTHQGGAIAGASRGEIALYRIDASGASEDITIENAPSGDYLSLRQAEPIWFTLSSGTTRALYELVGNRLEQRADDVSVLHGPVVWQEGMAWLQDGELVVRRNDQTMVLGSVNWKCLKRTGDLIYACIDRNLVQVVPTENGYETETVFRLTDFKGVDTECLSADSEVFTACQRQWFHYAGEAGLLNDDASPDAKVESSGCTTSSNSNTAVFLVMMFCLMRFSRKETRRSH